MPTVSTVSLNGLSGHPLTLTATVVDGPAGIVLLGGASRDDRELRDRVHTALVNSGQPNRDYRVEVFFDGPASTLPSAAVATAALIATAALAEEMPDAAELMVGTAVVGVDGSLRPSGGALPAVQVAHAHGLRRVIVPAARPGRGRARRRHRAAASTSSRGHSKHMI